MFHDYRFVCYSQNKKNQNDFVKNRVFRTFYRFVILEDISDRNLGLDKIFRPAKIKKFKDSKKKKKNIVNQAQLTI